ncbi:IS1182 family transposase [Paracraurococcus lichenis]|uniref:IS1182 family transposase n=1 Tax=Paracraurococcus lichenis TaxID=3064888 RepID=A0ABT9ECD2_9PROT|nr:IS1182 family transposase [Paracraurococcus sp. LOR1-02]MDO9713690.1 IS1182 family transposase [Paracraurococcus sp. LOR1-02]
MKRFVEGEDRRQATLLPESIDDFVSEENPVRVIDAFVAKLDLAELGFEGIVPERTGRPAYHPATLLKIYIYGYLNRIPSSRRLEREAGRNLELMWLTGRLAPDFKTIADFRKDNGPAIRATCRRFVLLCRELGLLSEASVAIDGSKFKAVNARERNYTLNIVRRRMEQTEASVARYLAALETADRQDAETARLRTERLKDRLARLEERMAHLRKMEAAVRAAPDGQVSLTDPDARAMATTGKDTGLVGYNVQAAVDTKHHLIVAHEVTNIGNDRTQLSTMAGKASEAIGTEALTVLADRGYFAGEEVLACTQAGHIPLVPKPMTSGAKADGRFGKQDFVYLPEQNAYRCPAGETMKWWFNRVDENGMTLRHYWTTKCPTCPIKAQCTPAKLRRITRWEHEGVLDAMQRRLDAQPNAMRLRRQTAEHPFGTLKTWMGAAHFLTRTMKRVSTEMSLHVLAYNMKRVIAIKGIGPLLEAIPAR